MAKPHVQYLKLAGSRGAAVKTLEKCFERFRRFRCGFEAMNRAYFKPRSCRRSLKCCSSERDGDLPEEVRPQLTSIPAKMASASCIESGKDTNLQEGQDPAAS